MTKTKKDFYLFTYSVEIGKGIDPAEQIDQDFYDITSNNDKISRYGHIEKVKQ